MQVITKNVHISGKNSTYWSDDGGLSWYWIGARAIALTPQKSRIDI